MIENSLPFKIDQKTLPICNKQQCTYIQTCQTPCLEMMLNFTKKKLILNFIINMENTIDINFVLDNLAILVLFFPTASYGSEYLPLQLFLYQVTLLCTKATFRHSIPSSMLMRILPPPDMASLEIFLWFSNGNVHDLLLRIAKSPKINMLTKQCVPNY